MNDEIIRRAARRAVVMDAQCRVAGAAGKVSIVDLTAEGCCIALRGLHLRAGQAVRIIPDSFQPLPGTVRWVAPGFAGIEFDSPLYGPVADHLQKTFAALGAGRS